MFTGQLTRFAAIVATATLANGGVAEAQQSAGRGAPDPFRPDVIVGSDPPSRRGSTTATRR